LFHVMPRVSGSEPGEPARDLQEIVPSYRAPPPGHLGDEGPHRETRAGFRPGTGTSRCGLPPLRIRVLDANVGNRELPVDLRPCQLDAASCLGAPATNWRRWRGGRTLRCIPRHRLPCASRPASRSRPTHGVEVGVHQIVLARSRHLDRPPPPPCRPSPFETTLSGLVRVSAWTSAEPSASSRVSVDGDVVGRMPSPLGHARSEITRGLGRLHAMDHCLLLVPLTYRTGRGRGASACCYMGDVVNSSSSRLAVAGTARVVDVAVVADHLARLPGLLLLLHLGP